MIENLNGFLRIYLKKKSRFENISKRTLKAITSIINLKPRGSLNIKSVVEVLEKLAKSNRAKIIQKELQKIESILEKIILTLEVSQHNKNWLSHLLCESGADGKVLSAPTVTAEIKSGTIIIALSFRPYGEMGKLAKGIVGE